MERRIVEDVEGWPSRPLDGGYDALRELADREFSGAVNAGGTWLFVVNGKVVGVFDGELEDVEHADGTAYKAPHPSLPLLYAMQSTGGDTRAKYYTNDTPISEVDRTLSSGSFTGYVELSENVLSGDYYQLYHAGSSMSVAFVGNSGRMITGEEAFERADDEVGIYEVVDVDLEVMDVPGGEDEAESDEAADEDEAGAAADDGSADDTEPDAEDADESGHAETAAGETAAGGDAPAESEQPDSGGESDGEEGSAADAARGADQGGTESESPPGQSEPADAASATAEQSTSQQRSEPRAQDSANDASTADSTAGDADEGAGVSAAADRAGSRGSATDGAGSSSSEPGGAGAPQSEAPSPSTSRDTAASDRADGEAARNGGTQRSEPHPQHDTRGQQRGDRSRGAGAQPARDTTPNDDAEVLESEEAWREATTVPSLDPDHSEASADGGSTTRRTGGRRSGGQRQAGRNQAPGRSQSGGRSQPASQSGGQRQSRNESSSRERSGTGQSGGHSGAGRGASRSGAGEDVDDTFEEEVLEREDRIDRLQQRASNLEEERDELLAERDRLEERVEELEADNEDLRSEIRQLESEIEELEAAADAAGATASGSEEDPVAPGGELTPRRALEGTDLFVRFDSKSEPTLEEAHDGSAEATAVNQNLRLDVHTQFEDEGVTVDGQPFEAFLEETMAYRFVEWLVRDLLYEIRDTGSTSALRDLYDALPGVDRVEFHGTVARQAVEDDGEDAPNETFDVVVRDKMGEALFVANMNESRDPATGRMIVDLQEAASRVKGTNGALASAFFVTRSFFEPAALETASEATSGSLLSRDSRKSFVKLSRKQGYHLCLVEARGDDLHLNVPEL